jgi:putative transposase
MSTQTNETNETIGSTGQWRLAEASRSEARAGGGERFGFGPDDQHAATTVASADALVDGPWLDALLARVDQQGLQLTGEGGFLPALVKAVLERGLAAELTDHLGYERGDPAGRGASNSRNGTTPKTLQTEVGPVGLDAPRDRNASFEPRLVPKGTRRLGGGLDEMIVSLWVVSRPAG